jgi:diamine N-acetyltransferase
MKIKSANYLNDREELHKLIQKSFLTVAIDFNLTKENAPTNPAFLPIEKMDESIQNKVEYFVAKENDILVGCIAIQPSKNENEYYIERLCVLPEYRHRKIGFELLNKAIEEIKKREMKHIRIGIINENTVLKTWYKKNGFQEYETKKFEHLPFTVCFMGINC